MFPDVQRRSRGSATLPATRAATCFKRATPVQAEKATGKNIVPFGILAVDPPGKIQQQLVKNAFEEIYVTGAARSANLINPPGCPGMHGRIYIREGEFIGRDLAVGVHVPFPEKKLQLLLRKSWIEMSEGQHVEGEIPGGEPRILPFVRHRNYVAAEYLQPIMVASVPSAIGRLRLVCIPSQPVLHDVVVELFGPEQAGRRLSCHILRFLII